MGRGGEERGMGRGGEERGWGGVVRRGGREKHQWQHPCSDSIHSSLGPPPPPSLPLSQLGLKWLARGQEVFSSPDTKKKQNN